MVWALVTVLPKKLCMCEAPGSPGRTMGSSGSRWLYVQSAGNSATRMALMPGAASAGAVLATT